MKLTINRTGSPPLAAVKPVAGGGPLPIFSVNTEAAVSTEGKITVRATLMHGRIPGRAP
jgi:hypothetical protein